MIGYVAWDDNIHWLFTAKQTIPQIWWDLMQFILISYGT